MKLEPDIFPIDRHLDSIAEALNENQCVLVKAQTGAGKTTRLPPYLLQSSKGKILVLEPRRLAAKLSANRCAELLEEEIGKRVGHHIRFDKKSCSDTQLLFITEGLFLPYLRNDPELSEYSTIILDEFHERSLHTDIAIALIRKLQASARPDLKLIVMSATLETQKLEVYLDSPIVFDVPGKVFPVDIEHRSESPADAIENMLTSPQCPLNVLVFLSGMGMIRSVESELKARKAKGSLPKDIDIVPLHSSLPKDMQDRAFQGKSRKIILSTNIAETSLTIPNITGVVDLGDERRASYAPWSGMPLLMLEKISKASATQRAGRAGRTQSGLVYRLYDQGDFSRREAFTPPEIKRVELSHTILDLIELGLDPENLNWFEPPEEKNLLAALSLLEVLGAIKDGKITKRGRFLAKLPLHPRLGAMLYTDGDEKNQANISDALLGACIISEGSVYSKNASFSPEDDEVCDLCVQIDLIKAHILKDKSLSDYHTSFLDLKKTKRVMELYKSLAPNLGTSSQLSIEKTSHKLLAPRLIAGFPDRLAAKRVAKAKGRQIQSYNFCLGRGGKLSHSSALNARSPDFIIVLDALENPRANAATGTNIQAASEIKTETILNSGSPYLSVEKESVFNEKKGTVVIASAKKYAKLTISSKSLEPVIPKGEALLELMKENWPWPFAEDHALKLYNRRIHCLEKANIEHQCPSLCPKTDAEMFELFLETCVEEDTDYQALLKKGLQSLITEQLAPQDLYVLETDAPLEIKLSNGKSFSIFYDEEAPYISARAQDLFSTTSHPSICQGKIPLNIKLLSPANRVAQITKDLPGFWKSTYEDFRKDLKARYPKHFWPENPESAPPVRIQKK